MLAFAGQIRLRRAIFAQLTAQTPPSWGVREIENAEVGALGRVGSGMDLARIWNGLLQLCDDLSAFVEVRGLIAPVSGSTASPAHRCVVRLAEAAQDRCYLRRSHWVVDDIALGIMVVCSSLNCLKITGSISGDRMSRRNRGWGLSESSYLVGLRTMHRRLLPFIEGHSRLRCSTAFRDGRIS